LQPTWGGGDVRQTISITIFAARRNVMSRKEVVALMKSSRSEPEWNANCDKVKVACGGYPDFWFAAIVQSGLMGLTRATW